MSNTTERDTAPTRRRVSRGLAWLSLSSSSVGLLDIGAALIILRFWVSPHDYGVAVLATSLFPILEALGDMGMPAALVQRDDDHSTDTLSSVFWASLAL